MLVRSFGAEGEFSVGPSPDEHVVDLTFERQRQRIWTSFVIRLSSTNHKRTVLSTSASSSASASSRCHGNN